MENIIVTTVKNLISSTIKRFAKDLKCDSSELALWIYCELENGYPDLKLLRNFKSVKDLTFGDLGTSFDKMTYAAIGFDIARDTPLWIQKFILKSSKDHGLLITIPKYMLILIDNKLHAFMYVNNKQLKEINIEYILQTE